MNDVTFAPATFRSLIARIFCYNKTMSLTRSWRMLAKVLVIFASHWLAVSAEPLLIFNNVPPYGSSASLIGLVQGADPDRMAVVVFICVPGYGWFSKPTCAQQLTSIHLDGSWTASIVTGGS